MRQAVMTSPGKIEFREVDMPEPEEGEVLIKVMSIGICGSDIHVYHGIHPYTSYPVVQGHEVSGVVVQTGKGVGVSGFNAGDSVTVEPQRPCGKCFACRVGNYNICEELKVIGFQAPGCASDFFTAPAESLIKLDSSIDYNEGALIEPLAVAVRAVKRAFFSDPEGIRGKQVLVLGAGPIGNLVAQAANGLGASRVLISDINDFRLEKAEECGIVNTVNPMKLELADIVDATFSIERKADVIFECTGNSAALQSAILLARKGTPIVEVAVFGSDPAIDMARINENELLLIGTARYHKDDFHTAQKLLAGRLVTLVPLVTDIFSFDQYLKAYEKLENDSEHCMKVIVQVNVPHP